MDLRAPGSSLLAAGLLAACVTVGLLAFGVTAVPNAQLTVSEVTVDPDQPVVGEPFSVTPTIESSVGSDEPVTIDSVTATVDGEEVGSVTNEGTLSPGDEVSVPFTTTVDEPGEYTVEFEITGTDASGETVTLTRDETVVVTTVPAVRLTVDDVGIEPETPTVGAPVTLPITVDSSGGSTQPLEVDSVSLLDGGEQIASAENLGSLAVGDSITVPLTTTFSEVGEKRLVAKLRGTNANGAPVALRRPVTVVVEDGAPVIEMGNDTAVDGVDSSVSLTVSNPTEATLRNIVATVGGDRITGELDRRVVPALEPGESEALSFVVRPDATGEVLLETDLAYATAAGTEANVSRTDALSVEPLEDAVSVRVNRATGEPEDADPELGVDVAGILDGGGTTAEESEGSDGDVRVTVSNLGNAPVSGVVLEPKAGERSLGPRPVADELAPGSEASALVSLERTPATEIAFEVTYELASRESAATATFDPAGDRGSVAVTGIDLQQSGDSMDITGDIGNPGGSEVSGVVVSVDAAEGITPTYPNRDFFVGAIDGDSFAPFELTASVDENASHVPLTVQYVVDGDERTETVEFPIEEPVDSTAGDGPSLVLVGGVLAMLGIVLTVIVLFARRE